MITATVKLKSVSPYSQSRYHATPKEAKESHADYENRTWKEKGHYDQTTGEMFIPPMSLKLALDDAAKRTGKQIPGKGKATFTKHFVSGVMCMDPVAIGYTRETVSKWTGMMDSTGKKGSAGGTRVERSFPDVPKWTGTAIFHILDETITKDVFREMLEECGKFIGLGRFRPQNGGFYGRFAVEEIKWEKV